MQVLRDVRVNTGETRKFYSNKLIRNSLNTGAEYSGVCDRLKELQPSVPVAREW